uniref:Uncharacterized protein n=1 Tax=Rhizophora mucronata TaxID=61149 RepID=A0A2P2PDH8_RHIMU
MEQLLHKVGEEMLPGDLIDEEKLLVEIWTLSLLTLMRAATKAFYQSLSSV